MDADTVHVRVRKTYSMTIDFGFGINAPEMRGPEKEAGTKARDFLRDIMSKNPNFTVKTHKDTKGKYGRYLVDIYLQDGTHVNALLVEKGHAEWKNYG